MKKLGSRIVGTLVMLGVVVLVVVFGWQEPRDLRFAVVAKAGDARTLQEIREGMMRGATNGDAAAVLHTWAEGDGRSHAQLVATLAEQGYDGIALSPVDVHSARELIEGLTAKGIAVVTFGTDVPQSGRLAHIGTDHHAAGHVAAQQMIRLLGATARQQGAKRLLVQIVAAGEQPGVVQRIDGFKAAAADTNIECRDIVVASTDAATCLAAANKAIAERPHTHGFFCTDTVAAHSVALAIERTATAAATAPARPRVVAFGTSDRVLGHVRAGRIDCAIAERPRLVGRMVVQTLIELALDRVQGVAPAKRAAGKERIDSGVTVVRREDLGN